MKRELGLYLGILGVAILVVAPSVMAKDAEPCRFPGRPWIQRFKAIAPGEGWAIVQPNGACPSDRLYWTGDDGKTWRDVTPIDNPTNSIGQVFFLDHLHGWMFSTDALGDEANARFYLMSTEDGGRSWRKLMLTRPMFDLMDDYYFPIQLFFVDSLHGWILWHWGIMHSTQEALLATSDGGRTWKRVGDELPGASAIQFISSRNGWLIGAPEDCDGFGCAGNAIWVTHNGGASWKPLGSPLPKSKPDEAWQYPSYLLDLKFKSAREGVAIGTRQLSGTSFSFYTCRTHDGGRTWRLSHFEAYHADASIANEHVFWSVIGEPAKRVPGSRTPSEASFQVDKLRVPFPQPDGIPAGAPVTSIGALSFADDLNGWALYGAEGRTQLISTTDGGRHWRVISPPVLAQVRGATPTLRSVNGRPLLSPLLMQVPPFSTMRAEAGTAAAHSMVQGSGPRYWSAAGGPMKIRGTGFLRTNTVWFGSHSVLAASEDGQNISLLLPKDLAEGSYELFVENKNGKTVATPVEVRRAETLQIRTIQPRTIVFGEPRIHIPRGHELFLSGSGFLLDNTVWLGNQCVPAHLTISGMPVLHLEILKSIAPGAYDLYVTNANGKSNTIQVTLE